MIDIGGALIGRKRRQRADRAFGRGMMTGSKKRKTKEEK
jgi:hypothetical protein